MRSPWNTIALLLFVALAAACGSKGSGDVSEANVTSHNVGNAALNFLRADSYRKLVIEVRKMDGASLSDQAMEDLRAFLAGYLDKPDGIELVFGPGFTNGQRADKIYSVEQARTIESEVRTQFSQGPRLAAMILIVDGKSDSENTLAHAYGETSIVLYGGKIAEVTANSTSAQKLLVEKAILRHEFGHLMGLVNIGASPTQDHQDHAHGAHCAVETCIMYWQINSPSILSILPLLGGNPPDFDSGCKADLAAAKSR